MAAIASFPGAANVRRQIDTRQRAQCLIPAPFRAWRPTLAKTVPISTRTSRPGHAVQDRSWPRRRHAATEAESGGGKRAQVARFRLPRLRRPAAEALAGAPRGPVPVRLRRREAGAARRLRRDPLGERCNQDVRKQAQCVVQRERFSARLGFRLMPSNLVRQSSVRSQRCPVHPRHRSASAAMIPETAARRSPRGMFRRHSARPAAVRLTRRRSALSHPA